MYFRKIALICLLISVCQTRSEVNDSPSNEQIVSQSDTKTVPMPDDDGQLGLFVNASSIPSVRQGKETLRKMCIENAGNESYDKAELALNNIKACFQDIINFTALPSEVENAKPTGNLDTVFKQYCKRTEELEGCVASFLIDVEPCLADNQKSSKYVVQNITEAILKFACEYEGDHIALFISEQGPQCIFSKQQGIQECIRSRIEGTNASNLTQLLMNKTQSDNVTEIESTTIMESIPEQPLALDFELEQCKTAYDIRKCIIRELSQCSGSTPANVVESVFNLIQNATSCSKYTIQQLDPNYSGASVSVSLSMVSVIIPVFTVLSVRFMS